jgi:hypothetical protein
MNISKKKPKPLVSESLKSACFMISETKGYRGMGITSIAKDCGVGQDRLYKIIEGKSGVRGLPFEVYHKMSKRFPFVEELLSRAL